jgi:hypothetical protein
MSTISECINTDADSGWPKQKNLSIICLRLTNATPSRIKSCQKKGNQEESMSSNIPAMANMDPKTPTENIEKNLRNTHISNS